MSESDDSQEFDPQEVVEQRESSDPAEGIIRDFGGIFSRVLLSYLIASVVGFFVVPFIFLSVFEFSLVSASLAELLFIQFIALIIGPLSWYGIRRYID
jgi:hypothetical protein